MHGAAEEWRAAMVRLDRGYEGAWREMVEEIERAWSTDLLTTDEQVVLGDFSVFAGPVGIDDIEVIAADQLNNRAGDSVDEARARATASEVAAYTASTSWPSTTRPGMS